MSNKLSSYIYKTFQESIKRFTEQDFLFFAEDKQKFNRIEINNLVKKICKSLIAQGLRKGDKVMLSGKNSLVWICCFLACTFLEITPILLNSNIDSIANIDIIKENKIKLAIATDVPCYKTIKKLQHIINILNIDDMYSFCKLGDKITDSELDTYINLPYNNNSSFIVVCTSGSDGTPKNVMISSYSLTKVSELRAKQTKILKDDILITALQLYHVMGLMIFFGALILGHKLVLCKNFSTQLCLDAIEDYKATFIAGVPTMYHAILKKSNSNLTTLKSAIIAGAPLNKSLLTQMFFKLNINNICTEYGSTETLAISIGNISKEMLNKSYYVVNSGKPLPGVSVKISKDVDLKGKILIKSDYIMLGYLNDKKEYCDPSGYFEMGDIGIIDKENCITIFDKYKNVIIHGGQTISPVEIENVFMLNGNVENVGVVGISDVFYGEKIVAFVKAQDISNYNQYRDDLKEFLSANLPKTKIPSEIIFLNTFPYTFTGKIQKYALKKLYYKIKEENNEDR